MSGILSVWGLSLNETLLIFALLLVIVDFFLQTDIPTHVAYVLLALLIGINLDLHILYRVVAGVLSWFLLVAFHYVVWKRVLFGVSNRLVAPDRHLIATERVVGSIGEIKHIEGKQMVCLEGDLWPLVQTHDRHFEPGTKVRVLAKHNGELEVQGM